MTNAVPLIVYFLIYLYNTFSLITNYFYLYSDDNFLFSSRFLTSARADKIVYDSFFFILQTSITNELPTYHNSILGPLSFSCTSE